MTCARIHPSSSAPSTTATTSRTGTWPSTSRSWSRHSPASCSTATLTSPAPRPWPRSITYFFPAYNEEGNLAPLVQRALEVLPEIAPSFEVIIVDDGSRDGTAAEAERLGTEHEQVRYVRHETNRGYGEALRSGFHAARMDAIAYTDGDRQFDL